MRFPWQCRPSATQTLRSATAWTFVVSLGLVAPLDAGSAERRPNILLVFADDQRFDTIAALGNAEIRTPHFDRLVARGFSFTNAYCMGSMVPAVCTPSRTMLLTGRSLWRIPENPRAHAAPEGVELLPTVLNRAGFATWHCGKRGNSCTFAHAAFETNLENDGRTAASATEHANRAVEFLERHDGSRPFFMYLAPPVPHDPRLAPDESSAAPVRRPRRF
jgi:arylsulfatase A-like enzyme